MENVRFPSDPVTDAGPFEMPEINITDEAPRPLFDSRETWAEQTRRLIEQKALGGEED